MGGNAEGRWREMLKADGGNLECKWEKMLKVDGKGNVVGRWEGKC